MTTPPTTQSNAKVEERHRDAAANYFTIKAGPTLEAECMREGSADHWPLVQAFARFEASLAPTSGGDRETIVEAAEMIRERAHNPGCDSYRVFDNGASCRCNCGAEDAAIAILSLPRTAASDETPSINIKVKEADRNDWPQKSAEEISEIISDAYVAGANSRDHYNGRFIIDNAYDWMMKVGPLVLATSNKDES